MGSSVAPLSEFQHTETSETLLVEFLRTQCTKNLFPYKARWSVAAHGILNNSTTGVSAHGIL